MSELIVVWWQPALIQDSQKYISTWPKINCSQQVGTLHDDSDDDDADEEEEEDEEEESNDILTSTTFVQTRRLNL